MDAFQVKQETQSLKGVRVSETGTGVIMLNYLFF